jgi:hypothetical protein
MIYTATNLWMYSNTATRILCENILKIICKTHIFQLGLNFLWWWTVLIILSITDTLAFLQKKKLHGLSPRANYTDRATACCRRSDCQLLRIEGATWSAWRISTAVFSVFWTGAATFLSSSSSVVLTRLRRPCSRPTTFFLVVPGIEPGPPDL